MGKNYKVNGQEVDAYGHKVTQTEEANYTERKLKTAALVALSVIVLGLNAVGIAKYFNSTKPEETNTEYAYYYNIDETDSCEPITVTRYIAPVGYILEGTKCYKINGNGEKEYTSPSTVIELKAPDGYVLIGNKCYRLVEPEVNKGR